MMNQPIISALIAFLISIVTGPVILPLLRKLKAGQTEREDGPKTHLAKTGTPTMGAFIFLISAVLTLIIVPLIFNLPDYLKVTLPVLFLTLGFAIVGFIDDYIKVILKRSEGLTPLQKFSLQIVVALIFALYIQFGSNDYYEFLAIIPFTKNATVNFSWFNIPLCVFIIVGTVNGSNFTDGVDGLETSVTSALMGFFVVAALKNAGVSFAIVPAVFLGALLGFLMFNVNKALVFMGDTGSLALGGLVCGLAYSLKLELYIPIIALIYFVEVLSVIIQVAYFKITHGKRIFRMAPIHHHFELGGWQEAKVVCVFSTITLVLSAISILFL